MDMNKNLIQIRSQLDDKFKAISVYKKRQLVKKSNGMDHNFKPGKTTIDLTDQIFLDIRDFNLTSFDEVYAIILDFAKHNCNSKTDVSGLNIGEIDISENSLSSFFSSDFLRLYEMEKLQKLSSVRTLNILNNLEIESIQDAVKNIQLIMPCLTNLSMSLSEEEDVSFILNHMQQLEVLNGIKVERQQLFNNGNSSSQQTHEDQSHQITNTQDYSIMDQSMTSNRHMDSQYEHQNAYSTQQTMNNRADNYYKNHNDSYASKDQTIEAKMMKHLDAEMLTEVEHTLHQSTRMIITSGRDQLNHDQTLQHDQTLNHEQQTLHHNQSINEKNQISMSPMKKVRTFNHHSPTKSSPLKKDLTKSRQSLKKIKQSDSPIKKDQDKENNVQTYQKKSSQSKSPHQDKPMESARYQQNLILIAQHNSDNDLQLKPKQIVLNSPYGDNENTNESQRQVKQANQNTKQKTIDSSPCTPMVKAQYSENKNNDNPDVGNFANQMPWPPTSIYNEEKAQSKEARADNSFRILQNILQNEDSMKKTQSYLATEKESSSLIKNTQHKSMSDVNSQRSSVPLTSVEQQKMNQLRENIINYNQDLNDFENDPNFENSNLKAEEKLLGKVSEEPSSNILSEQTQKDVESLESNRINKTQEYSPVKDLQAFHRKHAMSQEMQVHTRNNEEKTQNQLSEILEDDRETDMEKDHNSKGTGNFGLQYTVESSKFNAKSQQNSVSNHNWKQIGNGLRDNEVFCNTFNPNMGNLLENDGKPQEKNTQLGQIQLMTQQINLDHLHNNNGSKNDKNNNIVIKEHVSSQHETSLNDGQGAHFLNINLNNKNASAIDDSSQMSLGTTLELKNELQHSKFKQNMNAELEKIMEDTKIRKSSIEHGSNQTKDQTLEDKKKKQSDNPLLKEAFHDEEAAQLKPKDLEDIGNIFDRIRILHKKKQDSSNQAGKKFIVKTNSKVDDLAIQFDKKLSEVMLNLSHYLKDHLTTNSQKHSEIEKSKYQLYSYCQDTTIKILNVSKGQLNQKETKEMQLILAKINEGMNKCFETLGSLFYSRQEVELKNLTMKKIDQMKNYCVKFDEIKDRTHSQAEEIIKNKQQIHSLVENCIQMNKQTEQKDLNIRQFQDSLNHFKKELTSAHQKIFNLQQYEVMYHQLISENRVQKAQIESQDAQITNQLNDIESLTEKKSEFEKDILKLNKQLSNLKEEISDLQNEADSLYEENQQYLDMIIRYSLGSNQNVNGTMKVNPQWLKKKLMKMKMISNELISDLRSQYSPSNFSRSPLERNPKEFNFIGKLRANSSQVSHQKLRKLKTIRTLGGRVSRFSNVSQSQHCQESHQTALDLEGSQRMISELGDINKMHSSIQFDMNIKQFSKNKLRSKRKRPQKFQKIDKYSFLHSQKKQPVCSPHYTNRKEFGGDTAVLREFSNIQITQTNENQITQNDEQLMIFEDKEGQVNKLEDDSIEYCKPDILIKSQISHGSYDDVKKKNEESPNKIEQSAVKSLNKVGSQHIEKSCTKDNPLIERVGNGDQLSHKNFDFRTQIGDQDGHKISVYDVQPSPTKSGMKDKSETKINLITSANDQISDNYSNNVLDSKFSRGDNSSLINGENIKTKSKREGQKMNNISYEYSDRDRLNTSTVIMDKGAGGYMNQSRMSHNHNNQSRMSQNQYVDNGFSFNEVSNPDRSRKKRKQGKTNSVSPNSSKTLTTKVIENDHGPQNNNSALALKVQVQNTHPSSTKRSKSSQSLQNLKQQDQENADQMKNFLRTKLLHIQPIRHLDDSSNFIIDSIKGQSCLLGSNQLTFNQQSPVQGIVGSSMVSPRARKKNQNINFTNGGGSTVNNQVTSFNLKLIKGGSGKVSYTLKQLREIIVDIYTKKEKHDYKCMNEYNQNRETMEQFLYTYLNQKYGLKAIVIDQINAIVGAIDKYQVQDHDVLLFGKVLRHEVNEEFRKNIAAMKASVESMIKTQISEKNPLKGKEFGNKVFSRIQSDKQAIDFMNWNKIVFTMYEQTDAMIIEDKLRSLKVAAQMEKHLNAHKSLNYQFATDQRAANSRRARSKCQLANKRRSQNVYNHDGKQMLGHKDFRKRNKSVQVTSMANPKVYFSELIAVLKEFLLEEHEKFLSKFLDLFRQIDQDHNGMISNQEFVDLYTKMNIKISNINMNEAHDMNYKQKLEQETNNFLDILDPYQSDKITLSDVVKLFSNQIVEDSKKSSLLNTAANIDLPVESASMGNGLEKTQKLGAFPNPDVDDAQFDPNKFTHYTQERDFHNQLKMLNLNQDSKNLTQIDELTDSQKNVYSLEPSRACTPALNSMPKAGESIIKMSQEDLHNFELMNNNLDLSDIQLLNEYEKKISKDIVELEKKMQEFKK